MDTSNFGDYEVVFASPDLTDQISVTVTVPRLRKLTLGKKQQPLILVPHGIVS